MIKDFLIDATKIVAVFGTWTAGAICFGGADPALLVVMVPFVALLVCGVWTREFG